MQRNSEIRKAVFKLMALQMLFVLLVALAFAVFSNIVSAYSALLGGITCIIPGFFFARKLFRRAGALEAKKIMGDMFKGEAIKVALTVLMFIAAVKLLQLNLLAFLLGYILAQIGFWFAPTVFRTKALPKSPDGYSTK